MDTFEAIDSKLPLRFKFCGIYFCRFSSRDAVLFLRPESDAVLFLRCLFICVVLPTRNNGVFGRTSRQSGSKSATDPMLSFLALLISKDSMPELKITSDLGLILSSYVGLTKKVN